MEPDLTNPANQAFMKLAEAQVERTPAYFHAVMYSAGRWIVEAAKAVDGKVEDRERFLAAIRRASETIEDPRGPIKLDEYGNPTENVYILKVEQVGGKAAEHRDPHLPDGLAVLDLQAGGLPESSRLRPQLSTGEAMSGIRQVGYFDCPGGGQVVVGRHASPTSPT